MERKILSTCACQAMFPETGVNCLNKHSNLFLNSIKSLAIDVIQRPVILFKYNFPWGLYPPAIQSIYNQHKMDILFLK